DGGSGPDHGRTGQTRSGEGPIRNGKSASGGVETGDCERDPRRGKRDRSADGGREGQSAGGCQRSSQRIGRGEDCLAEAAAGSGANGRFSAGAPARANAGEEPVKWRDHLPAELYAGLDELPAV